MYSLGTLMKITGCGNYLCILYYLQSFYCNSARKKDF